MINPLEGEHQTTYHGFVGQQNWDEAVQLLIPARIHMIKFWDVVLYILKMIKFCSLKNLNKMLTKYLLRLLINGYESSWVDASEPLQHLHRSHHGKYKSFSTSHFSTDSSITPPELYFIFCWEHWSWEEELSENIIWIKYLWTNNIFSGENFLEQRNSTGKLILLWFRCLEKHFLQSTNLIY